MGLFSKVLREFGGRGKQGMRPFSYYLLSDGLDNESGALISWDKETAISLAGLVKSGSQGPLGTSYKGVVSNVLVDQLGMAIPAVSTALQTGGLFQFTASQAVMNALASGQSTLMQNQFGLSGIIQGLTGKVQSHGGFNAISQAPIVAPLIVWQVIHAVFAVSHLRKINLKLDQIIREIEDLSHRMQAKTYGDIWASNQAVKDIIRQHENGGLFTEDMRIRLAVASQNLLSAIAEQSMIIKRYTTQFDQICSNTKKTKGAKIALQTLKEKGSKFQLDAHLYTAAGHASLQSTQAWILHDIQHAPENVERRINDLQSDLEDIILGIDPMRSLEELEEHASSCVEEMDWFQRNIFNKKTVKKAKALKKETSGDKDSLSQQDEVSIYFWQDEKLEKTTCVALAHQ